MSRNARMSRLRRIWKTQRTMNVLSSLAFMAQHARETNLATTQPVKLATLPTSGRSSTTRLSGSKASWIETKTRSSLKRTSMR